MKFSLSLTCAFLLLALNGCADTATSSRSLAQKPAAGYHPPYAQTPGYGQNVATSRLQNAPITPVMPTPAPPTVTSAAQPNTKVKAAILLPLTGRNAALGQAMLNAAQQAVFDTAGANFELQPRDTAGEGGAEGAARTAVDNGAQLIIGPLFASDIPAVKMVAQNAGLEMLTLSTDTSLAEHGVYVMGLAPGAQVERVMSYAAAHGAHHYAALVPNNPYGALVGQVFQQSAAQKNGVIIDYETYDPNAPQDLADHVKNLAMQLDQVDALFLPESGSDLKAITDQLSASGFSASHTHILGTGLWDVPGLGNQNPLLVGAWYAAPDPAARKNFIAAYAAAYGQEPPRLTTLAYDATALAAVLAKRGGRFDDAALTNPNGFAGLDGIFRLLPNGSVERALAVDEVTKDSARVIDPAPTSFVGQSH
jgi:ABC-type branched-subunit amino acid transport system substrate-binding protein